MSSFTRSFTALTLMFIYLLFVYLFLLLFFVLLLIISIILKAYSHNYYQYGFLVNIVSQFLVLAAGFIGFHRSLLSMYNYMIRRQPPPAELSPRSSRVPISPDFPSVNVYLRPIGHSVCVCVCERVESDRSGVELRTG